MSREQGASQTVLNRKVTRLDCVFEKLSWLQRGSQEHF